MSATQNITLTGPEILALYYEGGWAGLSVNSNWILNMVLAVGLTVGTYLAAKEDLMVY